jgi:hypothetical protein
MAAHRPASGKNPVKPPRRENKEAASPRRPSLGITQGVPKHGTVKFYLVIVLRAMTKQKVPVESFEVLQCNHLS